MGNGLILMKCRVYDRPIPTCTWMYEKFRLLLKISVFLPPFLVGGFLMELRHSTLFGYLDSLENILDCVWAET